MKVVITDSNLGDGSEETAILGPLAEVAKHDVATADDVIRIGRGAAGLLVQFAPVTAAVVEALADDLRVVVRYGIGLDNIDLDACAAHGVVVRNVDDYCLDEVAEHSVSLILANARRLWDFGDATAEGGWYPLPIAAPQLAIDDPVGVVGLGRIGMGVARRLAALGHPVYGWDPLAEGDDTIVTRVDTLTQLAERVNHLTLHAPLTERSRGMVDRDVLRALGPDGHLVNTSRGALVDEEALVAALDNGELGWASLDVLVTEPPAGPSAAVLQHPRVRVTPHIGWLSAGSLPRLRFRAAEEMRDQLIALAQPTTATVN